MPNTPNLLLTPETLRNKVYFSKHLTAYHCWHELETALKRQGVMYELLPNTADIWARDYMPIQCATDRYVTYTYNPDYLKNQPQYITNWQNVVPRHRLPIFNSQLVLDGGNIIVCDKKVILTDKIFVENSTLSHSEVLHRLQDAFRAEPIIIPWDKAEPYGHADGMVRYIGNNRVLLTNYSNFDHDLRKQLLKTLRPHFDEVLELHYDVAKPHKWNWAYINYLLVDGKLFIPRLYAEEDEQARSQLSIALNIPQEHIEMVDIRTILKAGGGLNCISWTIFAQYSPLLQDEFTQTMHKEFSIDEETEIKHRAGCVWTLLGKDYTPEQLQMYCNLYDITIAQAERWKDYWLKMA